MGTGLLVTRPLYKVVTAEWSGLFKNCSFCCEDFQSSSIISGIWQWRLIRLGCKLVKKIDISWEYNLTKPIDKIHLGINRLKTFIKIFWYD